MKTLDERLKIVEKHVNDEEITIMIIGLGSVGTYLLDFLVSKNDPAIKIVVVGRNQEKMQSDVNIVRVAGLIREVNKSQIIVEAGVDLNDIASIEKAISKYKPDFIVNSSRAYPGLKYGSISWSNVRAYGIWTPLSIRFTKISWKHVTMPIQMLSLLTLPILMQLFHGLEVQEKHILTSAAEI